MPGFNGTGPRDQGPMTGGGFGYCVADGSGRAMATGMGRGRGCRGGRGLGRAAARDTGERNVAAQAPVKQMAAESLTPREYLEWLESEMRRTRQALSREG